MYLGLEAYPYIGDVISDDNFSLNLYIVLTVCCIVIVLDDKILEKTN